MSDDDQPLTAEPAPAPFDARTRELAAYAFRTYATYVGGGPLALWDELPERERRGWCAAAHAVRRVLRGEVAPDKAPPAPK